VNRRADSTEDGPIALNDSQLTALLKESERVPEILRDDEFWAIAGVDVAGPGDSMGTAGGFPR
jgi:hypothetical protein